MRNLPDESSVAQSLDGNRLVGSLHIPEQRFSWCGEQTQQGPLPGNGIKNSRVDGFLIVRR
jgi:hypothetical protein